MTRCVSRTHADGTASGIGEITRDLQRMEP